MSQRTNAATLAANGITEYIKRNQLHPGDPLPTEANLCEALNLSRSSVREAVRTLSSLDIVEVRHGHGTFVGSLSLSPLIQGLVLRTTLDSENSFQHLRDVVEVRIGLDLSMADELCAAFTADDATHLLELVQAMHEKHSAGQSFAEEDHAYHRRLHSLIANNLIRELSDAFWQIHMDVLPLMEVQMPGDIEKTIEAHAAIVHALEAGDAQLYREKVLAHYAPLQRAIAAVQAR